MLTEELTASLHRHAGDVTRSTADLLASLELKAARRRRRVTVATVLSVTAVAALIAGVIVVLGQDGHSQAAVTVNPPVPKEQISCDEPTRTVPMYLDWPCPTGTASAQEQAGFALMLGSAQSFLADEGVHHKVGTGFTIHPATDVRMRVLSLGSLPAASGGRTFSAAEFWLANNTRVSNSRAAIFTCLGGPTGGCGAGGPVSAHHTVYNTYLVQPDPGTSEASCEDTSPAHEAAAPHCTDIFLVGPKVTALRLLRPHQPDVIVAVHHGSAGLPATSIDPDHHHDWQVQALTGNHSVIESISYNTNF
jgi:hypothetical protein